MVYFGEGGLNNVLMVKSTEWSQGSNSHTLHGRSGRVEVCSSVWFDHGKEQKPCSVPSLAETSLPVLFNSNSIRSGLAGSEGKEEEICMY